MVLKVVGFRGREQTAVCCDDVFVVSSSGVYGFPLLAYFLRNGDGHGGIVVVRGSVWGEEDSLMHGECDISLAVVKIGVEG